MTPLFSGNIPTVTRADISGQIYNLGQKLEKPASSKILNPVGNGSSGIFFLGEAPGPNDAKNGEPFTGPYSQTFNTEILPSLGLTRQSIYLTNVVKNSQPLGKALPMRFINYWKGLLLKEIAFVRPKLIITLGKYALETFLKDAKTTELRGKMFEVNLFNDFSAPVMVQIHPANAHRFPEQKDQILKDFFKIREFLDGKIQPRPVPSGSSLDCLENESLF